MCALFGSSRDISLFRHINRELISDIITQQCSFYKIKLDKTPTNVYGEAAGERYYTEPILLDCLVQREKPSTDNTPIGLDLTKNVIFKFLRDDLLSKDEEFNYSTRYGVQLYPEVGDIILYNNSYYEIDSISKNQFFMGKDPDYPNENNPYSPGLGEYGTNLSVICEAHYVPSDKLGITKERII